MLESSRKRAGFLVAAVVFCSLLVAVCLLTFTGHFHRHPASRVHGLSSVRVFDHEHLHRSAPVRSLVPKIRLSAHVALNRVLPPVPPAVLQAKNEMSRISIEEAQLQRIESDVEAQPQVSRPSSSAKLAAASGAFASAAHASADAPLLSQSQFVAAVNKLSDSKSAAAKGLESALETMEKLRHEEQELHKELGAVLGKITSLRVVTSMNIGIPDGMGGNQMEVVITRPVGGTAVAKVIKGEDSDVAAKKIAASTGQSELPKPSPPFVSHEAVMGSDGLGGSQSPLAPEAKVQPLALGKVASGMALPVIGDDGLGGKVHSAAAVVTNLGRTKAAFRLRDKRMDGVGGSGKQLFHRRSNKHLAKVGIIQKGRRNDGVGGDTRYREARNLKKIPHNRIRKWSRDCSDGLGGSAVWCARVISGARSSSSSGSASAVKAAIKAALIDHDAAAKDRAGLVFHHGQDGTKSASGQASGASAQGNLNNDGDGDEDGDFNGEFSSFNEGSGDNGNAAEGFRSDGSDDSFSSDDMSDNSGVESSQHESQGGTAVGGAPSAAGSSAHSGNPTSGTTTHAAHRSHAARGHHPVAGQNSHSDNSGDSSDSGSVADFQDQQEPQDESPQDQSSFSVTTSSDGSGDLSAST